MEDTGRGERILAAAGELLLAWGYRRVTIDEIARRAKVGKGTVYLHWKTKDALLLAVVLDSKCRTLRAQVDRMRSDPLEILPSRMMRGHYRDFLTDPVLRAVHTGDSALLGRLNDHARTELAELIAHGHRCLEQHLRMLREHGLVRADDSVDHQQHALMAVLTGFLMTEALAGDEAPGTPEMRADILARTVRSALETTSGPGPDTDPAPGPLLTAATAAAPGVIAVYEQLAELSAQEMRRQLRA